LTVTCPTQEGYYFADMMRFFATLNDEQFSAEREYLLKGDSDWKNQVKLYAARLAFGRAQEATQGMRYFLTNGGKLSRLPNVTQWEKYYRADGQTREEILLAEVDDSRNEQGRVYFQIALRHFGERNRIKAEEYFRKCAEHLSPDLANWNLSAAILDRIEHQPDWPKSIKMKK
jgi:hypothetical protein